MPDEVQHHVLAAGGYEAVITEVGGALHSLRFRDRDLVRGFYDGIPLPSFRGAVLVPWPNRIADGQYTFAGARHQLPINEVERACALHGLALWNSWTVVDRDATQLRMAHTIWPRPGYPFTLQIEVHYQLRDATGLEISVSARNVGAAPAPYGASIHPYLVAGEGRADDWSLRLDARSVVEVDPVRLLPVTERAVAGTGMDYRATRPIGPTEIDHAFTDVAFDGDNRATASLTAADGHGVTISWDHLCRWVQVHTADRTDPALTRIGVALEPMTCPPNAFNSGQGLIVLTPGDSHAVSWRIAAI